MTKMHVDFFSNSSIQALRCDCQNNSIRLNKPLEFILFYGDKMPIFIYLAPICMSQCLSSIANQQSMQIMISVHEISPDQEEQCTVCCINSQTYSFLPIFFSVPFKMKFCEVLNTQGLFTCLCWISEFGACGRCQMGCMRDRRSLSLHQAAAVCASQIRLPKCLRPDPQVRG